VLNHVKILTLEWVDDEVMDLKSSRYMCNLPIKKTTVVR
jgi:hypothetical protein